MSALVPKVTRELTKMKRTLHDVFNLDKLRPGQADVIRSVLEGNSTTERELSMRQPSRLSKRWRSGHRQT